MNQSAIELIRSTKENQVKRNTLLGILSISAEMEQALRLSKITMMIMRDLMLIAMVLVTAIM